MEEKGLKFLQSELLKKAQEYGCHGIELWQNDKDPSIIAGIGWWNSLEEARKFQSSWEVKEKELLHYCMDVPKREFFKIKSTYNEKAKRAA